MTVKGIFDRRRGTPITTTSSPLSPSPTIRLPFGKRQSDKEQAYADKWAGLADSVFRADNAKQGHVVQFYTNDLFLCECICEFVRSALADRESAIVVASKQHRQGLNKRLQLRGIDVHGALKQGRYIALDAEALLAKFMSSNLPDKERFNTVVGSAIEHALSAAGSADKRVAVFGEMVALLWAEKNFEGALRLEQLWNDLARTHSFYLRCAYPASGFQGDDMSEPYSTVCGNHTAVIPAEAYS